MDTYEQQAALFKVLIHPTRLAILEILRGGEECVCHMVAALGLRQAFISQQLMVLRQAGLIEDRRDGWNIFYRVVRPEVFAVLDAAAALHDGGPAAEQRLPLPLLRSPRQPIQACECPKCRSLLHAQNDPLR